MVIGYWEGAIDSGEALAIGPMGATLFSIRSTRLAQTVSSVNLKMVTPINGHTHKRALTDRQGSPGVYLESRGTSK